MISLNASGQSAPLSDFDSAQPYHFLLANSTGGITGFSTDEIALDLTTFANSYTGTFGVSSTGNRVYLDYTPVPEPSSAVLLLLGGLAAARRRDGNPERRLKKSRATK